MQLKLVVQVWRGSEDVGIHIKERVIERLIGIGRRRIGSPDIANVLVQQILVITRDRVNHRQREVGQPVRGDREILVARRAVARHVLAQVQKLDRVEDTLFGVDNERVDLLSRSESTRPHRVREVVFGVTLNGFDKLSVVH